VKYIVDASVLLAVGRGQRLKIQFLGFHRKRDLAVPEPVVVYTGIEVRNIAKDDALMRWTMLVDQMPRVPWTSDVTKRVLALEPPSGLAVGLDAITAAHALALDATLLTVEEARYQWIEGLRVDEL
jgi:predicted nucleic acid-binding protein